MFIVPVMEVDFWRWSTQLPNLPIFPKIKFCDCAKFLGLVKVIQAKLPEVGS